MTIAIPLSVPGMELLDELCRGAHCITYRARRESRLYSVAVPRLLHGDEVQRGHDVERFRREATAWARARHPVLPTVMEVGSAGQMPYLVTELVTGETLRDRLARGPLSEAQVLELGTELASALGAIHACALLHGDVHPGNILFEPDTLRVRLANTAFNANPGGGVPWPNGVGTLPYVAPERFAGSQPIDSRADLFSLGTVLYECLAGGPPFTELELRSLLLQHARGTVPLVLDAAPHIGREFSNLVAQLLDPDPDHRYRSADNLAADFERLLRSEELSPRDKLVPCWRDTEPRSGLTLLGRAHELSLLNDVWQDTVDRRCRVVTVRGPSGVGKTRFLRESIVSVRPAPRTILTATCEFADPKPFSAVRQLLEGYLDADRHRSQSTIDETENHVRALAGDFAPLLRVLSPLLGEVFRDARPVPGTDDAHKIFIEGLAEFLGRLLRDIAPVVVAVDNAHWLDTGSRRVLARTANQLLGTQALLLFATRTDAAEADPDQALTRGLAPQQLVRLELRPLGAEDTRELVSSYLSTTDLDEDLLRYAQAFTDHTPLSLIELLRTILDSGALAFSWGRWKLDREATLRLRLPSQTAELVAHRTGSLTPWVHDVLAAAAVLGVSFVDDTLISISEIGEDRTHAALSEARRAGLVEAHGRGCHRFVHDLVRQTLLKTIPTGRLQALHQRIAEALDIEPTTSIDATVRDRVTSLPDMDRYHVLAAHYAQGERHRNPRRVFETNFVAGHLALRSFDNERALAFFEIAVQAAKMLNAPPDPELSYTIAEARFRTGALEASLVEFKQVLGRTSDRLLKAKGLGRIAAIHDAALKTDKALSTLDAAFLVLGFRPPTRSFGALIMAVLAWVTWVILPFRRLARGSERQHLEAVLSLYDQASSLAFRSGDAVRFLVGTLASLRLASRLGPSPPLVMSYQRYAALLVLLGMKSAGLRRARRGEAVAESLRDPELRASLLQHRAVLLAWAGDIPGAISEGARLLDRHGHWRELSEYCMMAYNQQILEFVRGRWTVAWQWMGRAVERLAQQNEARVVPECVRTKACAILITLGRDAEGQRVLELLRDVTLPTPAGSALEWTFYAARVGTFTERGQLGHDFESLVRQVREAGFNPARVHLAMTEYYVHVAHARVHQCLRAGAAERSELLPRLREAASDLGKAARVPLLRGHYLAVRAHLKWLSGNHRRAEKDFAEGERLGRQEGAPWILYATHRGRAHMLRAQGRIEAARDEAYLAESLALAHGAAYRVRWIREEFELQRPSAIVPAESPPASTEISSLPPQDGSGQLESVLQVTRAHYADLEPERQGPAIVDELVRALRAERGYLYLAQPSEVGDEASTASKTPLHLIAARDSRHRDLPGKELDPELGRQIMRRGSAFLPEVPPLNPSISPTSGDIPRSTLVAPLALEGRVIGAVCIERRSGLGEFTEQDTAQLGALARQVPLALELMRTLSARARLEEHERAAQKMEAMGRLAGGIAHDFNNMLSAIRTSATTLTAVIPGATPVADSVATILGATDRAEELTQQLLAFSRSQSMKPEVVEVDGVIERAMPIVEKLVGPAVEVVTHVDPGIHRVRADRSQLSRILENLATNARDAMPNGGRLSIEANNVVLTEQEASKISGASAGTYVLVTVGDTGQGIDPAIRDKIFDPFFTTKASKGGTGLGLATTYGVVAQTGGFIDVESTVGKGTKFKIYLPRTLERVSAAASVPPEPTTLNGDETILLVEDEQLVSQAMCRILAGKGYHMLTAGIAGEALRLANDPDCAIDLVILDVRMPDMDGPELARELRKIRPNLRVLYTSGYTAGELDAKGSFGTRAEFLQKPVDPEALFRRVRCMLDA